MCAVRDPRGSGGSNLRCVEMKCDPAVTLTRSPPPQHGQRLHAARRPAEGEHRGRPARGAPQRRRQLPPHPHAHHARAGRLGGNGPQQESQARPAVGQEGRGNVLLPVRVKVCAPRK